MNKTVTNTEIPQKDMITRIENAMIDALKKHAGKVFSKIEPFDDVADKFEFLQGHDAAVFTLFDGSQYSPGGDAPTSVYTPRRTIRWKVYILVRSLRNAHDGKVSGNAAVEAVRLALQGQSFVGATPMMPLSDKLDARLDSGWRYVMEFTNHIPAISDLRFDTGRSPFPTDEENINKSIGELSPQRGGL